jgi:kynurenine 3-monooxygenase
MSGENNRRDGKTPTSRTDNRGTTKGTVGVIGAGLAGNMVAALLAKLGFSVMLFEKRTDERKEQENFSTSAFGTSTSAVKRSVNLALSYRGQIALKELGLLDEAMVSAIRMPCRIIHSVDGTVTKQAYGKPDEAIWSVGRQTLNQLLMKASENIHGVTVKFGYTLLSADAKTGRCVFQTIDNVKEEYTFDLVIGADGAYSAVRECMLKQGRINFSRTYIDHGYKELTIPPISITTTTTTAAVATTAAATTAAATSGVKTPTTDYAVSDYHGLHIWPRGRFMLIALPNPDKSFTATLFAPYTGPDGFDSIDPSQPDQIKQYFTTHFPDVLPIMPDLVNDYQDNPVGSLLTVRVDPWNQGKLLLLGDAAHAVVPFYGQGMNAAFEDAVRFYRLVKGAMERGEGSTVTGSNKSTGNSNSGTSNGSNSGSKGSNGGVKKDPAPAQAPTLDLAALAAEFAADRMPSVNALADLCVEHVRTRKFTQKNTHTHSLALAYSIYTYPPTLCHLVIYPRTLVPTYSHFFLPLLPLLLVARRYPPSY